MVGLYLVSPFILGGLFLAEIIANLFRRKQLGPEPPLTLDQFKKALQNVGGIPYNLTMTEFEEFCERQDKMTDDLWNLIDLYAKGDPNGDIQEEINWLLIELGNDCYFRGITIGRQQMANAIQGSANVGSLM